MKLSKIEWAKVRFLSLCLDGKHGIKGLYKASDAERVFIPAVLAKAADEEQGLLTVCVYPPSSSGIVDEESEMADAETIKAFAHEAMESGVQLDVYHDGKPVPTEDAAIVESFIIQANDGRFDGMAGPDGPVTAADLAGGWGAVIHLKTEEMRSKWKDGSISMGGDYATREVEQPMEKASVKGMVASLRRALSGMLSKKNTDGTLRSASMHVSLPRPGEVDWAGKLARPSFDISLSGDLTQD